MFELELSRPTQAIGVLNCAHVIYLDPLLVSDKQRLAQAPVEIATAEIEVVWFHEYELLLTRLIAKSHLVREIPGRRWVAQHNDSSESVNVPESKRSARFVNSLAAAQIESVDTWRAWCAEVTAIAESEARRIVSLWEPVKPA